MELDGGLDTRIDRRKIDKERLWKRIVEAKEEDHSYNMFWHWQCIDFERSRRNSQDQQLWFVNKRQLPKYYE